MQHYQSYLDMIGYIDFDLEDILMYEFDEFDDDYPSYLPEEL